jgi:hypothetical protein
MRERVRERYKEEERGAKKEREVQRRRDEVWRER